VEIIKLNIQRIVIHQIHRRNVDGEKISPTKSESFIHFTAEALDTFKHRFIKAIGVSSKAVPMSIVNQEPSDLPCLVAMISDTTDTEYIKLSYDIANKLADSQLRRSIPGGIIVIFSGTHGATPKRIVGIMKAEIHTAYEKSIDKKTNELSLNFIEEALLTPSNKLYKTAAFIEKNTEQITQDLNSKWDVLISDSQISQSDGKASAQYFYSGFLGCGYPKTSARITKSFYDATCDFLNDMDINEEKRNDLHNALISYLKHEKSGVIDPSEFSQRYFDVDTVDSYSEFLDDKGIPSTSFTKDIEHISNQLKTRKISFSRSIKLSAPYEIFKDYVEIQSINKDSSGDPVNWTRILIKDNIVARK